MARFRYLAFDADGRREDGSIDAIHADQAHERLAGLGLTVANIAPDSDGRASPLGRISAIKTYGVAEQADLAEQLALLFGAGLRLVEVLRLAAASVRSRRLRQTLLRLKQLVEDGQSLPDALASAGPGLSPLFISTVRMGETSSQLPHMLNHLATALRRQEKLTAHVGGALIYPFILIAGGMAVFTVMTVFLAPRLSTIFLSANRPMPAELAFFTSLGSFLASWGYLVSIGLTVVVFGGLVAVKTRRKYILRGVARLPVMGSLLRDASLVRLSGATGFLLQAGIPLDVALREVADAFENELFADLFQSAAASVEGGGRAATIFQDDQHLSPLFRELFAVGEQTNRLPEVLAAASQQLEAQTQRRTQAALTLLTPILTLVIGGAIAFLVYSVMSALMSVNDLAF